MTLVAGAGTLSVRSIDTAGNTAAGIGHGYTLQTTVPSETVATVTCRDSGLGHRHATRWILRYRARRSRR